MPNMYCITWLLGFEQVVERLMALMVSREDLRVTKPGEIVHLIPQGEGTSCKLNLLRGYRVHDVDVCESPSRYNE